MLRRPMFWIVFVVLSVAAGIFTFKNFSTAFPQVSIDLQMNRQDALRAARELAQKHSWPPAGFDQAAEFRTDQEAQNFIELEGGGKPELSRILKQKIFAPYIWAVRNFREADAHETLVRFTPEGQPYGFHVVLPEQEKGESKPVAEARQIAEDSARSDWQIDFSRYQLVESSKDDRPSGRTDHTFVYERQDERVGEGRYRLRLVVAGDKLSELTQFIQIPEAFTRRYEQMRSANEAISDASAISLAGYLLGFCGIGLFLMMRKHWVLWRQPMFWGLFIAVLMGLNQLNSLPLAWMSYDTAVSARSFAVRQVMGAIGIFALFAVLLTISFMAAETLSRRAFPHHIQFWRVWSRDVAASPAILGRTLAGYLLIAPFFAYEIVLYFFAQSKLGWWTPSDTIANPDLFASYVPSLSAIAQAAQAGFWEESLFRAAPLSVAALLGKKFGKPRAFIAGGMILQALVFSAGHAGYANQPAYARVVELIIPSFVFGTLFLLFGLLPGIVLHFAYDSAWMALPMFVASGVRAHVEQAIVILAVLVPLWVVLVNRRRVGHWEDVPHDAFNGAWTPAEVPEAAQPEPAAKPAVVTVISPSVRRALPIAGAIGLIVWMFASPFHTDAPPIAASRSQALHAAREALAERGIQLQDSWTVLSSVLGQPGEMNKFVWQTAGRDVYEKLLGVYVTPPSWVIRFARFEGDVASRAEEYQVYVDGSGRVFRADHNLPEAAPGKNLTQEEARAIAVQALKDGANFKEISADAQKRPARTDWTFTFKDTRNYGLPQGEPRVSIEVDGDQIVDVARYVYVPDEWARKQRAQQTIPNIAGTVCLVLVVGMLATVAIIGVIHWSRNRVFSPKTFTVVFLTLLITTAFNTLNRWPSIASQASTAQPLALQLTIAIVGSLVFGVFTAIALGLVAGLVTPSLGTRGQSPRPLLVGISVGLLIAGAGAAARHAATPPSPLWGSLEPAADVVSILGTALSPVSGYFIQSLLVLAVLYVFIRRPTAKWIWIVVGLTIAGTSGIETISSWLVLGLATGVVLLIAYTLVFRHDPELLIVTTATLVALSTFREGLQRGYPSALPGSVLAVGLITIFAALWYKGFTTDSA